MNHVASAPQSTRLERATGAAFLLLAGVVLLASLVTLWETAQLPALGLSWTPQESRITVVDPNGPTAGVLKPGDRLVTLNGRRLTWDGTTNLPWLLTTVRPGQPAELVIERGGIRQTLTIIPAAMDLALESHLIDYVGAIALWGLGLYVFLKRPASTTARLFLLSCLATALALGGNASLFIDPAYGSLRRSLLSVLVPVLLLNLVVSLPHDRWAQRPALGLRIGYGGFSLGLGLVSAAAHVFQTPWDYPLYMLILGNVGLGFALSVALVVLTYRSLPRGAARDRYRGAVTFLLLGALPFVAVITVGVLDRFQTMDTRLATLAACALPLALAYVVLRYQFLGIRGAVRQGVAVTVLLASAILILLLAFVLARSLLALIGVPYLTEISLFAAAVATAMILEPLRRASQRILDRVLDRRRDRLYAAVGSFGRELVTLQDLTGLLDALARRLALLFPHTAAYIVLREAVGYRVVRTAGPALAAPDLVFPLDGALVQRLRQEPVWQSQPWDAVLASLPPAERGLVERLQLEIVVPLLARNGTAAVGPEPALLGWIALGAQGGARSYDKEETTWLVDLAGQASIALSNAQLYDRAAQTVAELQTVHRQLAALQEVGISLTGHLPPREVLQRVVQGVLDSGRYSVALVGVDSEDGAGFDVAAYQHIDPQIQAQIEALVGYPFERVWATLVNKHHPAAQAIRQGQVWKFHDLSSVLGGAWDFQATVEGREKATQLQHLTQNQTYVLIPLRVGERPIGLMAVGTQRPDVPAQEIEVLRAFAGQAAVAIENARLWEKTDAQLLQRVQHLTALNAIAAAMNSTLDRGEMLDRTLSRLLAATRFDMGSIALLDEAGNLCATASHCVPFALLDWLTHVTRDQAIQMIRPGQILIVEDVATVAQLHDQTALHEAGVRAFCVVPLTAKKRALGLLVLGQCDAPGLCPEDVRLAEAVAHQVGIAIANARLYAEAQVERQKNEIILQGVGDGVCTTDPAMTLLSFNPAAARLLGWAESEAIGRPCREVLQCHDAADSSYCTTACPLRLAMQQREYTRLHFGDSFMRTRSGQRLPIWGVAGPLIDPDGEVLGGVLSFRDATYEAEMERLQAEFISMISHEVRAPLTNLKAAAQTFIQLTSGQVDDTRVNLAWIITSQCDRLEQLVQRVEDSAQFHSGQLQIAPLDPAAIAREVLQSFQERADGRVFELICPAPADLRGLGDPGKVKIVLGNLLDNAVKYSRREGRITVEVAPWNAGQVLVAVLDEGPPIPVEQRNRIFERFYRIDNSDARAVYGLGLGLHIARTLVEAQGGRIWVDEAAGPGNRFCFTLPRCL